MRDQSKQQGASILEFIIIIPVLLMFIVLVSEVGILFYTLNALNKSTQDAARFLSKDLENYNTRLATAENLLRYGSPNNTGQPLLENGANPGTLTFVQSQDGFHVTINATYQHDLIMGSALGLLAGLSTAGNTSFSDTFQLSASSIMRFTR